jgi:hypothetical protein
VPRLLTFPSAAWLKRVTLLALPFTVGFFLFFRVHDRPLAPYTIVDFELARTPARAEQLLGAWGAAGQNTAREALYIDFGFMPAYALFFSGLTLLTARAARGRVQTLGLWLALAPFAAWLCDAVENLALLRVLAAPNAPSAAALTLANACATLKFALLLACLLYWPAAWLLSRLRR